ncbi:ribonuclease P protein component [Marinomonas sp. MED121]|uniref:ribonuclease P protein component n=1 Tax=Marinomonas sp. MED121 TaxID=314277 RepID=UPI0000690177|nr:ribonuclease P protein component [Marinomonas sp. MED121]EAQ63094.1 ribonuclease P protein component [Marinomonas sp. MED121]
MTDFCFPRQVRLLTAGDYQTVFNHTSCKVFAGEFLLLATKRDDDLSRLGLIVAKKNEKRAVGRNRIKRLVRESFRHHKVELAGFDVVFLARQGIKELDNPTLAKRIDKAWHQLIKRSKKANNQPKDTKAKQK